MPGREKLERAAVAVPRIENLNAIVPRTGRSKSKVRMASTPAVHPSMKMDYSVIYKENEILEENLEEHLGYLKKNERKALAEKREELEEIRKQMEEITKLQEAVNSRNPGDTIDLLSSLRSALHAKQWAGEERRNRYLLKIQAERDKFSAKNLFNSRRFRRSSGLDFITSKKFVAPSARAVQGDDEDEHRFVDAAVNTSPKAQKPTATKSYLKGTFSSMSGLRPLTAAVTYYREAKEDDLLPPRSKSGILRSRSRRQLELLCRVNFKEDEPEVTADFQIDWRVVNEKRRRKRLQQVKTDNEGIQVKVNNFLEDVDKFITRPKSRKIPEIKASARRSISAKGLGEESTPELHSDTTVSMHQDINNSVSEEDSELKVASSRRGSNATVRLRQDYQRKTV